MLRGSTRCRRKIPRRWHRPGTRQRWICGTRSGRLEHLSLEQREVLLLVGLEQLDYAEVATILDIPVGTVMSRLARAREALRRTLQEPPRARLRRVK